MANTINYLSDRNNSPVFKNIKINFKTPKPKPMKKILISLLLFVTFILSVMFFSSCSVLKDNPHKAAKRVSKHPEWYCVNCITKDSVRIVEKIVYKYRKTPEDSALYTYYVYCDSLNNVILEELTQKDGKLTSIKLSLTQLLNKTDSLSRVNKYLMSVKANVKPKEYIDTCYNKETYKEKTVKDPIVIDKPIRDSWFWFYCMFFWFLVVILIVVVVYKIKKSISARNLINKINDIIPK